MWSLIRTFNVHTKIQIRIEIHTEIESDFRSNVA